MAHLNIYTRTLYRYDAEYVCTIEAPTRMECLQRAIKIYPKHAWEWDGELQKAVKTKTLMAAGLTPH